MSKTNLDADMDAELEEMEKDENSSGKEDDSDDDMDDDEDKEDPELLKQIEGYKDELLINPYNYNAHLELVTLLRKTDHFDQLRSARQSFCEFYPLTPELWIDWINDELKVASTDEEKQMVEDLFEKGVKDYVSVDLWLEYCQFGIGGIGTEEGAKKATNIFEKALTSCGRNIARGSLVWEAFREFEVALLSMIPDKNSKAFNDQKLKIINLYKRQLRVPLIGMDATMDELKEFAGDEVDNNIKNDFTKAKQKLQQRDKFEASLNTDDEDTSEQYLEYLQFELKEKDPVMIQQLFERAISSNCLNDNIWSQYLK